MNIGFYVQIRVPFLLRKKSNLVRNYLQPRNVQYPLATIFEYIFLFLKCITRLMLPVVPSLLCNLNKKIVSFLFFFIFLYFSFAFGSSLTFKCQHATLPKKDG